MLGRFFYGQCSLSEAFWKFGVLGLTVMGFISRMLMVFLKQSANYEPRFLAVLMRNISLFSMNTTAFMLLCFYIASFLSLVGYALLSIGGMYNTYKEYEKSKTLAFICILLIMALSYFVIKFAMY